MNTMSIDGEAAIGTPELVGAHDDLTIVLTAQQLDAVLEGRETPEHRGAVLPRLFGFLKLFGAFFELAAASALLAVFDPTLISKLFGIILALHAIDGVLTAWRQVRTKQAQRTLTERTASRLAGRLGASPASAEKIGLAVDIVLPLALNLGAGALRAAAVRNGRIVVSSRAVTRSPRIRLSRHEAARHGARGGHTLAKHVALPVKELSKRLGQRQHLSMASAFNSLDVAETSIHSALRANAGTISRSLRGAPPGTRLVVDYWCSGGAVGYGVTRASQGVVHMDKVRVVLEAGRFKDSLFYILTAYPSL